MSYRLHVILFLYNFYCSPAAVYTTVVEIWRARKSWFGETGLLSRLQTEWMIGNELGYASLMWIKTTSIRRKIESANCSQHCHHHSCSIEWSKLLLYSQSSLLYWRISFSQVFILLRFPSLTVLLVTTLQLASICDTLSTITTYSFHTSKRIRVVCHCLPVLKVITCNSQQYPVLVGYLTGWRYLLGRWHCCHSLAVSWL